MAEKSENTWVAGVISPRNKWSAMGPTYNDRLVWGPLLQLAFRKGPIHSSRIVRYPLPKMDTCAPKKGPFQKEHFTIQRLIFRGKLLVFGGVILYAPNFRIMKHI